LGKLLLASGPSFELPYEVTGKWYDSLQLAARLFPTVLPLLKDSSKITPILDVASDLLDSNLILVFVFKPWQETILKYADKRYRLTKADTLNYTVADYSVINILKKFNDNPSNAMLKKWLQVEGNGYHKQAIVLALLANKQAVSQQALNDLASSKNNRIGLYRNLKKYNKAALFPVKYRTQSYFAENLVQDAASDFSDDEANIRFIQARDMKYKGKKWRFFFYDVFISDEEEHWLAVAGPYNMDRNDISLSEARGEIYSEEHYDHSKSVIQMNAVVMKMEKPE
ncbi:MAG TPA: hypothetical protein VFI33_16135, partial [Puia sp.]|nr:hypothetical protein [Puia sp.]